MTVMGRSRNWQRFRSLASSQSIGWSLWLLELTIGWMCEKRPSTPMSYNLRETKCKRKTKAGSKIDIECMNECRYNVPVKVKSRSTQMQNQDGEITWPWKWTGEWLCSLLILHVYPMEFSQSDAKYWLWELGAGDRSFYLLLDKCKEHELSYQLVSKICQMCFYAPFELFTYFGITRSLNFCWFGNGAGQKTCSKILLSAGYWRLRKKHNCWNGP